MLSRLPVKRALMLCDPPCRDVAPRIGYEKPALIESRFFPALQVRAMSHTPLLDPLSMLAWTTAC